MKKISTKTIPASADSKIPTTPKAVEAVAKRLQAAKAAQVKAPAASTPAKAPAKAATKAKPAKVAKPEAAPKAPPAPVAAKPAKAPKIAKPAASAPVVTKIVATIDVGFGNHLTIRGDGPGLCWEQGVAMACIDGIAWVWSSAEATGPITFKVLANDLTWCAGEDRTVLPGDQLSFTPSFD